MIAAVFASWSESLPSVAETSVRSTCVEGDRERTGLQHERQVLRLAEVADVLDLRRAAADAVGEGALRRVDLRPGPDLAVEHDGEVLRDAAEVAALPQPPRDVLEAVLPLARELHADDRLAELVEVVAGARRLEVATRHLGNRVLGVVRLIAEEVVRRLAWRHVARAWLLGGRYARDDSGVARDAEHLAAGRHSRVLPREERFSGVRRPFQQASVLG